MPTLDLTDEELQGLILVCANASGPGVSWMLTNALLTKAQQAALAAKPQNVDPGDLTAMMERPVYDATTRPLEPPHRRRANSDDRG